MHDGEGPPDKTRVINPVTPIRTATDAAEAFVEMLVDGECVNGGCQRATIKEATGPQAEQAQ